MNGIRLSIFDLFKIGPGPSSSHTIGPMRAARDFSAEAARLGDETLSRAARIEVSLFGSLAATGRGHGTVRAVLAGLLGMEPENCPPEFLDDLAADPDRVREIAIGPARLTFSPTSVIFDTERRDIPHPNTLAFRLLDAGGHGLFEKEYYSVGGGFVQWKGFEPPARGEPQYPYATMRGLREQLDTYGPGLARLMLENESAVTGASEVEVMAGLDTVLGVMEASVRNGLAAEGVLPGALGLHRKARTLLTRSGSKQREADRFIAELCACAFATAEENAAGHVVVTAPTCGAAGVVPAVAHVMRGRLGLSEQSIREGLLAAAAVGFLAISNATIAGAEAGCQAEIGVASAMTAAMLAQGMGLGARAVENAAEIALEHHLGMTCDPVGGYVQIPCIERNAMGAVKAYAAYVIASVALPAHHKVGLDEALKTMLETGRDMCAKYKETSRGGLAVNIANC